MSTASQNIQTPPITPLHQKRKKINYAPSYLYQKGNIFYFRYRFSSKEKELFQHAEIRVSLKTGFIKEAKRLARQLRAKLEGLIMEDLENMDYNELKKKITMELKRIMDSYPEKHPASIAEIKDKMNLLLQEILFQLDSTLYQPEQGYELNNKKWVKISAEQTLERSFFMLKQAAHDPESLLKFYFPKTIIELLSEKIFTPDELTENNIPVILNEYHKIQLTINRILCEREKGNFAYEKQFITPTTTIKQNPSSPLPAAQETVTSPKLFDILQTYIAEKLRVQSWTERTKQEFIPKLNFFCELITNIPIGTISKQHIREVKSIIEKLPTGYGANYKKHSLEDIKKGIVPLEKRIAPTTLNKYYGIINSFLIWLQTNYDDITVDLSKILRVNSPSSTARQRENFSSDDLKKIFTSQEYKEKSFNADYKYWVPLIGYYTGMRLEEICQLYLSDIQQEESIWCFNLTQNEDKHLKTAAAVRKVPIHPDLIEKFEFLSFVEQQKSNNSERLFPELKKQNGRYSHYVSRWFGTYLKKINVKTNQNFKDFHSFRHTFTHHCKLADVEEYKVKEVIGHETKSKNITYGRYGKEYGLTILYNDVIKKIPSLEL